MANETLNGLKVTILVTDGFEQIELARQRLALDLSGAATPIVSPKGRHVRGWNFADWGAKLEVDVKVPRAHPEDSDALLLPGRVLAETSLRHDKTPARWRLPS